MRIVYAKDRLTDAMSRQREVSKKRISASMSDNGDTELYVFSPLDASWEKFLQDDEARWRRGLNDDLNIAVGCSFASVVFMALGSLVIFYGVAIGNWLMWGVAAVFLVAFALAILALVCSAISAISSLVYHTRLGCPSTSDGWFRRLGLMFYVVGNKGVYEDQGEKFGVYRQDIGVPGALGRVASRLSIELAERGLTDLRDRIFGMPEAAVCDDIHART